MLGLSREPSQSGRSSAPLFLGRQGCAAAACCLHFGYQECARSCCRAGVPVGLSVSCRGLADQPCPQRVPDGTILHISRISHFPSFLAFPGFALGARSELKCFQVCFTWWRRVPEVSSQSIKRSVDSHAPHRALPAGFLQEFGEQWLSDHSFPISWHSSTALCYPWAPSRKTLTDAKPWRALREKSQGKALATQ